MSRIFCSDEAVVVEMHDRPGFSPEDGEQIQKTLCAAGRAHARLVVDCAGVQCIGAAFLSALLAARNRLGARGGDIVLCNLHPLPRHVLHITHLDRLFPLHATRQEALDSAWPEPEAWFPGGLAADHIVGS